MSFKRLFEEGEAAKANTRKALSLKIRDSDVEVTEEERAPINTPTSKPVKVLKSQREPENVSSRSDSIPTPKAFSHEYS